MKFNPGFSIQPISNPMGFIYGPDCYGPVVEYRSLDSIRNSLLEPDCIGPDPVYGIAMDVGKKMHKSRLEGLNLLFGAVIYAAGKLGREPVRSQGHVHKRARGNKLSPPEIYEIWSGKAIVYMQESSGNFPGRCFAVEADPGEVVVVPPDWSHATVSADINDPLVFGAWCDRNFGFEYEQVRAHHGLAWFPILNSDKISWVANEHYSPSRLISKKPGEYHFLGLRKGIPIYTQFEENPEKLGFVADPDSKSDHWVNFTP